MWYKLNTHWSIWCKHADDATRIYLTSNVDVIENATKFIEEHKQKQKGYDDNNKSTEESSTTTTTAAEAEVFWLNKRVKCTSGTW